MATSMRLKQGFAVLEAPHAGLLFHFERTRMPPALPPEQTPVVSRRRSALRGARRNIRAAMIAAAAFPKFLRREFVAMDFCADAGMRLR